MPVQEPEMQEAIANASKCLHVCLQTYTHCLEKGGAHAKSQHLQLLTDCIKICETSLHFMDRSSSNHAKVCSICADICDACAESCAVLKGDQMQQCARACHDCAQSCRAMSA